MAKNSITIILWPDMLETWGKNIVITNLPSVAEQIHSKMFHTLLASDSELSKLSERLIHLQGTNGKEPPEHLGEGPGPIPVPIPTGPGSQPPQELTKGQETGFNTKN